MTPPRNDSGTPAAETPVNPTPKSAPQPEGDIMFEIEETVTIEQPIERVWAFVMDEANDPLWQEVATAS